jgi:ubiquinone biosynthesis protein
VDALDSLGLVVEDSLVDAFKDEVYLVLVENESKTIEPDVILYDEPDVTLYDFVAVLRKYRLVIPNTVMLMIKALVEVQDVCSKLYPEFILLKEARPLVAKSLQSRIQKEANIRQVGLSILERFNSLKEFPNNVNMTLKQLSKGSFILRIPDDNLKRLERIADRTSYRILLGLVVASIVVGMSLVVLATLRVLAQEPIQIAVLVYALAILIIVISMVELMRSRDKPLVHQSEKKR